MKIQYASDLHAELTDDRGASIIRDLQVVGDVLVLAGDITSLFPVGDAIRYLGEFCDLFAHVVYVAGNHEYYGSTLTEGRGLLLEIGGARDNLHVLDGSSIRIEGRRFVGASLWFPDKPENWIYRRYLNDFAQIEDYDANVYKRHAAELRFLREAVKPGDIVVTHYLPHPRSVHPQFYGSPLNRFFLADDAAGIVETAGAALWIHGHTHSSFDYTAGGTRVVCNPKGYGRENHEFNPGAFVEL